MSTPNKILSRILKHASACIAKSVISDNDIHSRIEYLTLPPTHSLRGVATVGGCLRSPQTDIHKG
jgi:hypothetical protein